MELFSKIHGVSEEKALEFVRKGYKTLDDLLENESLTDRQKIGIRYYDDLAEKIPREEILFFDEKIQVILAHLKLVGRICGSYRRKLPVSSDIDLLITCIEK